MEIQNRKIPEGEFMAMRQEVLQQWNIPTDHYAIIQLLLGYPREGDKHPAPKPRKEGRVLRMGGAAK